MKNKNYPKTYRYAINLYIFYSILFYSIAYNTAMLRCFHIKLSGFVYHIDDPTTPNTTSLITLSNGHSCYCFILLHILTRLERPYV